MVDHEPGDRRVIRRQPAADHLECRIGLTVRLDPPAGADPAAIRVEQQRQHHLRLIRRAARTATRTTMQGAGVHLPDHVEHEVRQMPLLQPVAHRHRHQEQLIARRTHIHPRRATTSATNPLHSMFRRPASHHQHHLLTQAPAAAISRKSPAQRRHFYQSRQTEPTLPTGPHSRKTPAPTRVLRQPPGGHLFSPLVATNLPTYGAMRAAFRSGASPLCRRLPGRAGSCLGLRW